MKPSRTTALVLLTTGLLTVAPGIASADSRTRPTAKPTADSSQKLAAVKAAGDAAIQSRRTRLSSATTRVASGTLTAEDRTALTTTIASTTAGLTSLKATLDSDTDLTTAKADAKKVFTDYRVLAVVLPQVHLVRAADEGTLVALPALKTAQASLTLAIKAAKLSGKDTSATDAPMADLATQIADATGDLAGISSTVLAVTPASFNADNTVLKAPRASLGKAAAALAKATADASSVEADLS